MESQNDNGLSIDLEYSMILNDMSMQWYFDAMGFYSSKQESGQIDGGMVAIKVMRANDMMKKAQRAQRAQRHRHCLNMAFQPLQCGGYNMDMVVELWFTMVVVRIQPTI